jgi:hypothetical protein
MKEMKYEKPKVVVLASAAQAIQSDRPTKPPGSFWDSYNLSYPPTDGAYEADE